MQIMILRREDIQMNKAKKLRLEKRGWKIGRVDEFLGLAPDEAAFIELKLALANSVKERRRRKNLTQVELARLLRSSQSRVAKIERGDASVSVDLLIRSLMTLGATRRDLARAISHNAT